jgi:hypothetical protein
MNEKEPQWFDLLRERPIFAERTFTRESMERIEREAARMPLAGSKTTRRAPWAWMAAAVLIAAGILWGGSDAGKDRLANWFGDIGKSVESVPSDPATELPSPTPAVDPAPSVEPSELSITPKEWTGYLRDQLPFAAEDVESIRVYGSAVNAESIVPAERMYVILQALNWLDLGQAQAAAERETDAVVRLQLKDAVYAIPYDSQDNAFVLGGREVHPDGQTTLLLYSFLYPGNSFSWFDAALEKARLELENLGGTGATDVPANDPERFLVNGKDYLGWEQTLEASESYRGQEMKTWDGAAGIEGTMGVYEEDGILRLDRTIVFQNDQYETADGIRVGSTSEEVAAILGEPNIKTDSYWGYRVGDYVKFHLYFEQIGEFSHVRYMALSMPL